MIEPLEASDKRGWTLFSQCCDIVLAALPGTTRSAILAAQREGVTGPEFVRVFVHAFESAIDISRDDDTWTSLTDVLVAAAREIVFRCPRIPRIIQTRTDETNLSVAPRVVFDSFARCFACAIAKSKVIPPDASVLANEFARCRRAWESETIEYDIIAPVTGIKSSLDVVEIANGLGLVWEPAVVTESSKHHLDTYAATPLRLRSHTVLVGRRALAKSADLDVLVEESVADVIRCVTAIRLATGKVVGCDTMHVLPSETHFQTFNAMANYIRPIPETTDYGQRNFEGSILTETEAAEVRKEATMLSGEPSKQLAIAIERFNFAMGRLTPEDQVIDLAIALESTICRGSGNEQLSYRFRLFGAAVLADAPGVVDGIKMLGSLYAARSKVVHAGKRLSDLTNDKLFLGRSVPAFVDECRELARRIVLEFLRQAAVGRSPEEYVQALERIMVGTAKKSLNEQNRGSA